jgi:hypothetical protein
MVYTNKDFKIGDSVRIIANTNFSINKIGDIGKITKIAAKDACHVDVPGRDARQGNCTFYSEIEPYEELQNTNYEIY